MATTAKAVPCEWISDNKNTNRPAGFGSEDHLQKRRWTLWLVLPLASLLAVGIYFADQHWPFRYRNVHPLLEQVFACRITVGAYHRIYFPHPGFVAKGLTLRRNSAPDLPPIGSTEDLVVQGTWTDLLLFRKQVRLVDVKGLHVVIPPVGSRANREDFPAGSSGDFSGPSTIVRRAQYTRRGPRHLARERR